MASSPGRILVLGFQPRAWTLSDGRFKGVSSLRRVSEIVRQKALTPNGTWLALCGDRRASVPACASHRAAEDNMSAPSVPPPPEPTSKPRKGRALLVAAIGVATMSYGGVQSGCGSTIVTSGNLVSPPPADAGAGDAGAGDAGSDKDGSMPVSGNLLPPPEDDAGIVTSGNLLPPPPLDGGPDAGRVTDGAVPDAGDAGDGSMPTSGNLLPPPALLAPVK